MRSPLIVLKLGGSVLRDQRDLTTAAHEVYSWIRRGYKVVAVVSAFEGHTDKLVAEARAFGDDPDGAAAALLAGTGEFSSASLLTLALKRAGLAPALAAPWTIGLRVGGAVDDAQPVRLNTGRIQQLTSANDVLVVPGFVGLDEHDCLALLGRGGSDLSALFIAAELGADRCRLIKDVRGLYEWDPALPGFPPPRRFATLPWSRALELDSGIIQPKAVKFAFERRLEVEVSGWLSDSPSVVGRHTEAFVQDAPAPTPLRVALLGCGTVGLGVYSLLQSLPDRLEVVGVCVRDPNKPRLPPVHAPVLADWRALLDLRPDILVEATPGVEPAQEAISTALARGIRVVSANKAVIAANLSHETWKRAWHSGALRFSAAVGGASPILEAIERLRARAPITRFEGIINGTTNYILDEVARARSFDEAVRGAQERGFAEADPSQDLHGIDAANKLAIISERGRRGGEIVVAASTILTMTYLTVKPVSSNSTCRDEFINACRAMVRSGTPKKYMERIADPSSVNADYADFWLAFDTKGAQMAKQIIRNSGMSVEKGKYDFPGVVHLFEHIVPDPPDSGDIKPWVG
ncbi:MAG: hypothetical protein H7Y88_12940, partial [Phycisphaerales bacterium]|nr:hypothetical protein [Phycisphaerales bacterium]